MPAYCQIVSDISQQPKIQLQKKTNDPFFQSEYPKQIKQGMKRVLCFPLKGCRVKLNVFEPLLENRHLKTVATFVARRGHRLFRHGS